MRRYLRHALLTISALITLAAVGIAYAAWSYHQGMTISAANGINEARYVRIGGIDQWVQIRGQDKANPVLLWLNGGPGCSTIPLTYFFQDWEKHFTVVMWDQRGEGKTCDKSGTAVAPTMTINRMADDGIELTNYLRDRLHKDKIVLLGHSWGSILGVHMARERPDLFHAYVGTGQVQQMRASMASAYPRLLVRARAAHNEQAIKELEAVGPPPYSSTKETLVLLKWANELDPMAFPISAGALWALLGRTPCFRDPSAAFSQNLLMEPILTENLSTAAAPRLDTAVIIIAGSEDLVTPDARLFFDAVQAPHKEFLPIKGAGHLAILKAAFLDLLVTHVLPLARTK